MTEAPQTSNSYDQWKVISTVGTIQVGCVTTQSAITLVVLCSVWRWWLEATIGTFNSKTKKLVVVTRPPQGAAMCALIPHVIPHMFVLLLYLCSTPVDYTNWSNIELWTQVNTNTYRPWNNRTILGRRCGPPTHTGWARITILRNG